MRGSIKALVAGGWSSPEVVVMMATRSSPDEWGGVGCSEPINRSRGEEGEVARCSIENGRAQSGVAAENGTLMAVGVAFNQ
jgi:hypothetical protein